MILKFQYLNFDIILNMGLSRGYTLTIKVGIKVGCKGTEIREHETLCK